MLAITTASLTVSVIVDYILLIGSICGAIVVITNFLGKPLKFIKKKRKTQFEADLKEALPSFLLLHDLETRDKYKADRDNYLQEIKEAVKEDLKNTLEEIKDSNKKQNDLLEKQSAQIEILNNTSRDVLREKIMGIYEANAHRQAMYSYERRKLDKYYQDYKIENGNSYIDGYYNLMKLWATLPDPHIKENPIY